jgi:lipopolysaccharide transport system permease protein
MGSESFLVGRAMIKKLPFPSITLGIAAVLSDLIHFLISIPLFIILALYQGSPIDPLIWLVGVPLLALIQCVYTIGLVALVASINVFTGDLGQLIRVVLLMLFYATPIIYPVSMVPEAYHWTLVVNPVAPLMIAWRELLTANVLSPYIGWAVLHMVIAVAIGLPVYRSLEWRLSEVL